MTTPKSEPCTIEIVWRCTNTDCKKREKRDETAETLEQFKRLKECKYTDTDTKLLADIEAILTGAAEKDNAAVEQCAYEKGENLDRKWGRME